MKSSKEKKSQTTKLVVSKKISKTSSQKIPVITVDGPGGSGKGTLSVLLAKKLGWHFLDSGALYRILAFSALAKNISLTDEKRLQQLAKKLLIPFDFAGEILLENQNITDAIRTEKIGNAASQIASLPQVRLTLLDWQRAYRVAPGLVADGRDMGTVVFPDAKIKFFLVADPNERAKRRYFQLKNNNPNVNLEDLLNEILERDKRDKERVAAPLRPAEDSIVIDTTDLGVEKVFKLVLKIIKKQFSIKC